jgi:hypothetical protein
MLSAGVSGDNIGGFIENLRCVEGLNRPIFYPRGFQ